MTNRIATPTDVGDLVDYQDGAVVSQVLFRSDEGVLTVFAFADGEGLTEHASPHDALVQVLEGSVRITVGGAPHDVDAGQLLHLPAGVPHALDSEQRFKMLLTLLKGARSG